jgi:hypothetical protein
MKPILLFLTVCTFLLSSCSKEEEPPYRDELTGTRWEAVGDLPEDYSASYIFREDRIVLFDVQWEGSWYNPHEYHYTYDKPDITIGSVTGRIEKDTMYLYLPWNFTTEIYVKVDEGIKH